jgi:glycosyltransferase involved in cell wall biosynthesis
MQCIITPSVTTKDLVQRELKGGFKGIPVHVIHNSIESEFFELFDNSAYSFPKKIIGWIGRFDKIKNYTELFEIASAFASSSNDIEFIIVGVPPEKKSALLSSDVSKFKGRVNFKWLPFIDHRQIHHFYNLLRMSGGCFLSTSKGECFCNVVIESMACRCPVVASNIDVFNEMLEEGSCGVLYKSGNVKNAVKAITKILEDHSYRDKVVTNAYTKVKKNFTIAQISLQWKSLFDVLINT